MQTPTVDEVLRKINEKLDEAEDFLGEMEKTKTDYRLFRHRLSAFLSAANSVMEIMEAQGRIYAIYTEKQGKTGAVTRFTGWYTGEENRFRTPNRNTKAKNPKIKGINEIWVYLRQARNDAIHLEQVNPSDKIAARDIGTLFKLRDESEPELPPVSTSEKKNESLWRFTELEVFEINYQCIVDTLPPPSGDVFTICKTHIQTLKGLIARCKNTLDSL